MAKERKPRDIYEARRRATEAKFEADADAMKALRFLVDRHGYGDVLYMAAYLGVRRKNSARPPKRIRMKAPQLPNNVLRLDDYR